VSDSHKTSGGTEAAGSGASFSLLCRAAGVLCALPIEHVIETMRLPAVEPLPDAPHFIAGLAIVRGAPLPVIDVARLFGKESELPERLVVARAGQRRVGLAVAAVVGTRVLPDDMLHRLPLLLRDASREAVSDIGALDGELMVVLRAARIVPPEIFAILEAETASS
jgi:purine-binding chemotaxis protein CheW